MEDILQLESNGVVFWQCLRKKKKQLRMNNQNAEEILSSEINGKRYRKQYARRILIALLNRLRICRCATAVISKPDPLYQVAYLGNVITGWAKGEGCVEKPLATLWRNYTQSSRPDVRMQLVVCNGGGLRATTKDHGLTEYWAHRLTTCSAPEQFPRLFCWVYRHENRRLRHELRCHAVLCCSTSMAQRLEAQLKTALALALAEFKRDKLCRQKARLSLANCVYENPSMPRRKILLSTAAYNYRPPLERSKSAPKLASIQEDDEDILFDQKDAVRHRNFYQRILRHCDSTTALLATRNLRLQRRKASYLTTAVLCRKLQQSDTVLKRTTFAEQSSKTSWCPHDCVHEEIDENAEEEVEDDDDDDEEDEEEEEEECPGDEGSLSSGCESASTVTSELEQQLGAKVEAKQQKTESTTGVVEFRVGGRVMATRDHHDQVISLIPSFGDNQPLSDFSSLKVFRQSWRTGNDSFNNGNNNGKDENSCGSGDESGYGDDDDDENDDDDHSEEVGTDSSIANVILI